MLGRTEPLLAAQMQAYLTDGLWLTLAERANDRAKRLAEALRAIPGVTFLHPPQANMLFCAWDDAAHERAQAAGARYERFPTSDGRTAARLVCNWSTADADIDRFLDSIR